MDPECIVSLANQAWISHRKSSSDEDCQEIETIIRKTATLCTNRVKLIEVRAEIAYSYARFGTKYYDEAETGYHNVLEDVMNDNRFPSLLWQYGYGLIKRRKLTDLAKGNKYKTEVTLAADLLYKVAKQDETIRFKARAWVELGNLSFLARKHYRNWHELFPKEIANLSVDQMFSNAYENLKRVNDIPALEHYAIFLKKTKRYEECRDKLEKSLAMKKSSRAYQTLAESKMAMFLHKMKGLNEGPKQEPPARIDYCEEVLEILSDYNSAIRLQNNYSAMACKAKFLYDIGQFKDAIDVIKTIYSVLQTNDTQPEDLDRNIQVFGQIYHAKCLVGVSRDAPEIMQAKDLLRSAIEMSFELQRKRLEKIHNNGDDISRDKDKLPRVIELRKLAIEEMKHLLQDGEHTTESIIEEIALCELIKDEGRAVELCIELNNRGVSNETQIGAATKLIKDKDFDKGLFLLKPMIHTDKLDDETKKFTIRAQVDGAMDALIKEDYVLTGTRLRDAFDVRFRDQEATDSDMLHVFFVAHERNKDATYKLQRLFDNSTKLNITCCFDATPGTSKLDNLEESLQESYVIAVLMDITDLKNEDFETEFFKKSIRMAQCTQMKHNRSKALVAIMLSEQVDIKSTILSDAPQIQLRNEFQDNTMFLCDFFMQALLN